MRSAAVLLFAAVTSVAAASGPWEGPRTFKASELLQPGEIKGPHHSIGDQVPTPGFFHEFTLGSDFGELEAEGLSLLRTRLAEVRALADLGEVSKSKVFLDAAGRSLESVGKSLVNVAKDPEGTAKGIGSGLKRFGVNLGRKTKRAADDVADAATKDDAEKQAEAKKKAEGGDSKDGNDKAAAAAESVANAAFGVNKSARIWAQKLRVDPYTTNPVLAKALIEVAKLDAAGGIATKVVVPIPTVITMTASVGDLVWGKDPEELRKLNEARLKELGVADDVAKGFFRGKAFSLTLQTRFIAALHAVKAKGAADYVDAARTAPAEPNARFFVESAEMLQALHAGSAVTEVLTDSRALVAKTADGRAVVLLPLDWVSWTDPVQKAASEIAARARQELGAKRVEMRLTGQASKRAREELAALGFSVQERVAADASASGKRSGS
jgi:hypothetical protein